jgi:hypothetical protein
MAYEVHWLYPSRVVLVRFSGIVTADELEAQAVATRGLVLEGTPPVHIIVDTLSMDKMAFSLMELRRASAHRLEEIGWTVLIRHNPIVQFFASIALQVLHMPLTFADTQPQAIAFLRERDPTLRDAEI